jgi:DNA-binding NarL/FixJ family response regulator
LYNYNLPISERVNSTLSSIHASASNARREFGQKSCSIGVMPDVKSSEKGPRAVICLEGSGKLWKLVNRALEGIEGSSEFIFARSGEASADILALCQRLLPALVLIEDNRIQVIPFKQLHDLICRRDIQILVFSEKLDDASYADFFNMGCIGVIPYNATAQILRRAVLAICNGELWLPRRVLSRLAHDAFVKGTVRKVTQRESEIFKLVCLGFTNQQIAEHLFISRETVRWHLRGLYSKIGVETRAGAIRYARHGLETQSALNPPIS